MVLKPEPANFQSNVRSPGQAFLKTVPNPSGQQFRNHDYWRKSLIDLGTAYNGICAYSSFWLPNSSSVDHFYPKSQHPNLAYEWGNYRLSHAEINNDKGNSIEILDPFNIQNGWFILDIATMYVRPETSLPSSIQTSVKKTIDILKLNKDKWVEMRFGIFEKWKGCTSSMKQSIQEHYPFIAIELQRQNVS